MEMTVMVVHRHWSARALRAWVPAFAGMTVRWEASHGSARAQEQMGSSFRWNDGVVRSSFRWNDGVVRSGIRWNDGVAVDRHRSARALRAWVPAFAGMTV